MASAGRVLTLAEAQFLIDHLFLPPKVPEQNHNEEGIDAAFDLLLASAKHFKMSLDGSDDSRWNHILTSIRSWSVIWEEKVACKETIAKSIGDMKLDCMCPENQPRIMLILNSHASHCITGAKCSSSILKIGEHH